MDSVKDFMDMKTDEFKLKAAENLSLVFSRFLGLFTIIIVTMIVLATMAFGGVLLLGDIIGSYAAGAFIVSGVFLTGLVILIFFRKKLFLNSFVRLFIHVFYGSK